MSIYQSIKKFGTKALLVGGLVAALSGCADPSGSSQIFKDVNRDGKPDQIYLVDMNFLVHDYQLNLALNNGDGTFSCPKEIARFNRPVLEVHLEDINGDGNPDLLYLVDMRSLRHDYNLYSRLGDGMGNFSEQKLVRHYDRPVERISK